MPYLTKRSQKDPGLSIHQAARFHLPFHAFHPALHADFLLAKGSACPSSIFSRYQHPQQHGYGPVIPNSAANSSIFEITLSRIAKLAGQLFLDIYEARLATVIRKPTAQCVSFGQHSLHIQGIAPGAGSPRLSRAFRRLH